ncbi:hypothetical protein ACLEPN_27225 [Myxococcus sp. 1LA]
MSGVDVRRLVFLDESFCSPDFNPIELWWADLKRQLRRHAPRVLDELA